jgi:peptidoglycan hydrolase CwlO-like protein
MKQIEELGDKTIGIDIDGDKKPDFKIDVKSIAIVIGFIISGTMGYNNLKQEIELAKELPAYEVKETSDGLLLKQKVTYLEKEIEKLEKKVSDIENKIYKR